MGGYRLGARQIMVLLAVVVLIGEFMLVGHVSGQANGSDGSSSFIASGALLRGRTVIIDPGHGGFDPGARGLVSQESVINLEVALKLKRWFRMAGARVLMTWDSPSDIPSHKKYRVRDRLTWINQQNAEVLIDIHCNSGASSYRGPQTFYWNGAPSYHLAHDIQEEMQYLTHTRRDVKRIDQYVLRYAKMPAVNVEIGFITNPTEERQMLTASYQEDLAWYIFVGTERWLLKGRWPASLLDAPPPTDLLRRT